MVAVDAAEMIVSSPEAVVEDFWDVRESFLAATAGVFFLETGKAGFLKTAFEVRFTRRGGGLSAFGDDTADSVLLGLGLGLLDRDTGVPIGDATVEPNVPFSPTLEGVCMKLPIARLRTGDSFMACVFVLKAVCGRSVSLDPGRLNDARERDCIALPGRWLDVGRSLRLLAGRDGKPNASVSKKLEWDALVRRAGDGDNRDNVSIVLSAKDGRDVLGVMAVNVSPPNFSSSSASCPTVGLGCEFVSVAGPGVDGFVILGVRILPRAVVWELHCEDGRFLRLGSFVECI